VGRSVLISMGALGMVTVGPGVTVSVVRVESTGFGPARPISAGDEWIYFESTAFLVDAETLLLKGQFLNVGGELRIMLEVAECAVKVAAVDERHVREDYVYGPAQRQIGEGRYRLN
jgi:hypothetical protein